MCKIFGLSDATRLTPGQFKKLVNLVNIEFSKTEKDGFGWAGYSRLGLHVERYVNPLSFIGPYVLKKELAAMSGDERKMVWVPDFSSEAPTIIDGSIGRLTGPLILHGRTATNDVNLDNTHPFVREGFALVHNGVVEYSGPERPLMSSCDSEFLLNEFIEGEGPASFHQHITGYYAVLAIDPLGRLHVVRDNMAQLWAVRVTGTPAWMFCTSPVILRHVAQEIELPVEHPFPVTPHTHVVFNETGVLSVESIQPCAQALVDERLARKSLGALAEEDEGEATRGKRRRRRRKHRQHQANNYMRREATVR